MTKQVTASVLKKAVLQANSEEAEDADYKSELEAWDNTLMDGFKNDRALPSVINPANGS